MTYKGYKQNYHVLVALLILKNTAHFALREECVSKKCTVADHVNVHQ